MLNILDNNLKFIIKYRIKFLELKKVECVSDLYFFCQFLCFKEILYIFYLTFFIFCVRIIYTFLFSLTNLF